MRSPLPIIANSPHTRMNLLDIAFLHFVFVEADPRARPGDVPRWLGGRDIGRARRPAPARLPKLLYVIRVLAPNTSPAPTAARIEAAARPIQVIHALPTPVLGIPATADNV